MFSRALRTSRAAPLRSNAFSRGALVKRSVTTDAASAHADKDAMPQVNFSLLFNKDWEQLALIKWTAFADMTFTMI